MRLWALCVALGCLWAPTARGADFGYQDNTWRESDGPTAAQVAELASSGGATVHRVMLDWQYVEPRPGARDFSHYDELYQALRARGVRPLFILMSAPRWAWEPGTSLCTSQCAVPPSHSQLPRWRSMAAAVAMRYPDAAGIEIWNEPNLSVFWDTITGPDAAKFTELLREAYWGIKGANPSMTVVAGGFSNNQRDSLLGDKSLWTFLNGVYAAGGRRYMDAIGFHPYPSGLDLGAGSLFDRSFRQVRDVAARHGDGGRKLWVTEVGFSTSGPQRASLFSEEEQAAGLLAVHRNVSNMPDVETLIVHSLIEPAGNRWTSTEPGFGVVRRDLTPKPAFCALSAERGNPCK